MAKLYLLRHGQSIWNLQNRFTGWVDISLSENGKAEAKKAGLKIASEKIDVAFTSTLTRAQQTLFSVLEANTPCKGYTIMRDPSLSRYMEYKASKEDEETLKVYVNEALNERDYGKLKGMNKDSAREQFGEEQVKIWRRSFDVPPPEGESLKDTAARSVPYFKENIVKELKAGKTVLVVAHGNSLRSLVMHIENMTSEQILEFEMKTGVLHMYSFDENMKMTEKAILDE
ncbi:MAG: 2,3-diphosphoglycerate-dependent phosphoglycerate mutase [Candidatus Woesearchaeota archaeon]|nr:2,3-diphosphoglycerate-dependent phosphoglycerate mutase [Nanoarchaeota archaeon]USN44409.1 MAG: 2,3-diphosphoglycerate-dependent phosphoglycerate mutase [Candidatus Woesearchaeota archaeon]